MDTLKQRLNFVFSRENTRRQMNNEKRLTKTDLWKAAKLSSSAVSHWFNGTNEMDLQTAFLVSPLLRCNPVWLFDGSGHAYTGLSPSLDTKTASQDAESFPDELDDGPTLRAVRSVPVVGEVQGGVDGYLLELEYPTGHGDGRVPYYGLDQNAYALRVRGDSMHPRYRAGEFVIVEPNHEPQPGDDVVVCLVGGQKMLKLLNWIRDGEAQFLSINDGHKPLTVPLADIERMQRVMGHVPRSAFIRG